MSDSSSQTEGDHHVARMDLEPDAFHEGEDGYLLDCPECGSTVSIAQIIEEGRCDGTLDAETTEVEGDDEQLQEPGCTAKLSLQLLWKE
jgi:hypothetical protein